MLRGYAILMTRPDDIPHTNGSPINHKIKNEHNVIFGLQIVWIYKGGEEQAGASPVMKSHAICILHPILTCELDQVKVHVRTESCNTHRMYQPI